MTVRPRSTSSRGAGQAPPLSGRPQAPCTLSLRPCYIPPPPATLPSFFTQALPGLELHAKVSAGSASAAPRAERRHSASIQPRQARLGVDALLSDPSAGRPAAVSVSASSRPGPSGVLKEMAPAAATPSPTTHHRPLPTMPAPAPSSTLSLRPRQVPPPPPPEFPAGFVPRMVAPVPDLLRPKLKSVVVGGSCSVLTVAPLRSCDARPHGARPSPVLPGGKPRSHSSRASSTHLPPPPASLPPGFTPAFLGRAPHAAAPFGSGSAAALAGPPLPAPSTPDCSGWRLQSVLVGSLLLTSPEVCAVTNVGLTSRSLVARPPTMSSRAKAPTGILRGMASISSAPARPPKTVRFCIPAPRIPDPAPGHAATTTPPRSPTSSSSEEDVPDSAPAFPARGMAGPRAASPSVGSRGEAVFYTAGSHPIVRSIVVATSTQQRTGGNLALSPRDTALSARDDEGWLTPKKRRRPRAARLSHRLDGSNLLRSSMPSRRRAYYCSPRSNRAPNNHSSSSSSSRSRRSPVRRCRRCRASDHFAAACRDPVRCDRCDRSGHWARDCHQDCPAPLTALRAALPAPTRSQPWPPPPPSSAPCGGVVPEHGMDFFDASAPPPTPVPPARGRASSQRLRSVITGSLNLEASAPADCVAPALGSVPQHLLLDVVVAPPPVASLLDPVAALAPVLRPPARRLVPSKEKLAGRHSASPTHARHAQSAPASSTSSDLALGSQDHAHPARVLACERCYKRSVDDVLSAENKRTDLGLLQMQGKVGDRKTAELEVILCLSTAATGEVLPEVCCSHPLLSPDTGLTVLLSPGDAPCEGGHPSVDVESVDGLTMVLISPGGALCDGGFSSEDDEDEEMEQLLPCLADLDQQELLLDGEEVGDWARRELEPVVDVIDADAEAAMIGNLLVADTHVNSDDDDVADAAGTTPTSGIVIRSVADLLSLPVAPLLPMPIPPMPRADAALPAPDRRSGRLAAKPQLPAVGKAQRVLHKKMGFDFGAMPLVEATKEFTNACKKAPFSDSAIRGLSTLLKLNLPSMTAADEALIGLAGPGGSDFPPPSALDVSA